MLPKTAVSARFERGNVFMEYTDEQWLGGDDSVLKWTEGRQPQAESSRAAEIGRSCSQQAFH
jgi:hypothetical protein